MSNRENRRAERSKNRRPVSKTQTRRGNLMAVMVVLLPLLLCAGLVWHAQASNLTTPANASAPASGDTQDASTNASSLDASNINNYATGTDAAKMNDPSIHEVDAKDLKAGDAVVLKDGRTEIIKSVQTEDTPDETQVASNSAPASDTSSGSNGDEWILAPDHISPPLPNGDPAPLLVAHSAQDPGFHVVKLLKTETDGNKIILTGTNQDTNKPETIIGMRGRDTVFTLSDPDKAKLPTKAIQNVKQGDLVVARNPVTGATEYRRVVQTYKHLSNSTITATLADVKTGRVVDTLIATPEHPFFVPGRGAVPLGQLGIGTQVVTRAGPPLKIVSLVKHDFPNGVPVYNFEVQGDHTYFVGKAHGGTWVHNNCYTTLYRAVSPGEAADIAETGMFRGGGLDQMSGKWFAESAEHAAQWGQKFYGDEPFDIVAARFRTSTADQMFQMERLDNIGPARYADPELLNGGGLRGITFLPR